MSGRVFVIVILALMARPFLRSVLLAEDCPNRMLQVEQGQGWDSQAVPRTRQAFADRPPTISVAQMKVPVKARDTLQKAIHALQKNPNAAVERYIDKALELYPHYSNALALRAVVERDIYPEQAAVDAEKAVEYDSSYGPGYVALGSVYVGLGRLDDAVRTLDYAIAINPNAWQGYYEMSRALLGKRDYAAALHQIQKACSLAKQNYPFLHFQKAQILIGMSNASAAIVELEAYLREEPNGQVSPEARRDLDRLRAAWRHD